MKTGERREVVDRASQKGLPYIEELQKGRHMQNT
jgi:hypothetical protein